MPLSGSSSGSYYYPGISAARNDSYPIAGPASASLSSTFLGNAFSVVLGPIDISRWKNYKVSIANNSVNNLKSGSIEVSPDQVNWEVLNSSSFTPLTSSGFSGTQFSNLSNTFLRVRGWPSGSGGGLTGSLRVTLNLNN